MNNYILDAIRVIDKNYDEINIAKISYESVRVTIVLKPKYYTFIISKFDSIDIVANMFKLALDYIQPTGEYR